MSRKSVFIAAVLVLIAGSSVALGQRGPRAPRQDGILRELASARVQARLNLTSDQVRQIQEIVRTQRAKNAPAGRAVPVANVAQERMALMKAIFSDNPNQTEIEKHQAAIADRQAAAAQQSQQSLSRQVNTLLEINKVFTPAQRVEFQKMLDENARTGQILQRRIMMRQNVRRPQQAPAPPAQPPEA